MLLNPTISQSWLARQGISGYIKYKIYYFLSLGRYIFVTSGIVQLEYVCVENLTYGRWLVTMIFSPGQARLVNLPIINLSIVYLE
jgi:hypothetical protein